MIDENMDIFNRDDKYKKIIIFFDDIEISSEDIYSGQFSLEESICADSELRFGGCEVSKIQFKINNKFPSLQNKTLTVKLKLQDVEELFTVGRYKVFSEKLSNNRKYKEIIAYDYLYDLTQNNISDFYNGIIFPISIKNLRDLIFEYIGLEQEDVSLVNDELRVDKTEMASNLYVIDVLKDICEINGCFGRIGRNGKFQYVFLDENEDTIINKDMSEYSSVVYEDFRTAYIDEIVLELKENSYTATSLNTTKNSYIFSPRILEYHKDDAQEIVNNMLSFVENTRYTPLVLATRGNPCIECGDYISVITKDNVIVKTYILQRKFSGTTFIHDEYTSTGNQRYENKSTNSSVSGGGGGGSYDNPNDLQTLTLTNSTSYEIKNQKQVLKYNVASSSETNVICFTTIPFYADLDGLLTLSYHIDREHIQNQDAKMYFNKGYNVLSVCNYFPLKNGRMSLGIDLRSEFVESDLRRTESRLLSIEEYISSGGNVASQVPIDITIPTVYIEKESIRSILIAKGLTESAFWDGTINISERVGYIKPYCSIENFTGNLDISKLYPDINTFDDVFGYINNSNIDIMGFNSNLDIGFDV